MKADQYIEQPDRPTPATTQAKAMKALRTVLTVKIAATVLFWCVPLLLLPSSVLAEFGVTSAASNLFVRLLGWAYLALCVGYYYALVAARRGEILEGPIAVGIVSNGGASALLTYYGLAGHYAGLHGFIQFTAWTSAAATLLITVGLIAFGWLPAKR